MFCNVKTEKPELKIGYRLEKIDNELAEDNSTNNLIEIFYQIPSEFIEYNISQSVNPNERYFKMRSFNWRIRNIEYSNWKGYFNTDTTTQINIILHRPLGNGYNLESMQPFFLNNHNKFKINNEYYDEILLNKDYTNFNLMGYKGLMFKSKWLLKETKDTVYNSFILLFVDDYQFNATIDLINCTDPKHKEITSNFIKSLWIKIEKNGRGYGD